MFRKLKAMPYAQAQVIVYDDGTILLQSYRTIVAEINDGWLRINGLYSATTRRHIGAFVKEYCNITYQAAKLLYINNWLYNLETGELTKAE